MITKKDLQEAIRDVKQDFKDAIDQAIIDIIESISKVAATKNDLSDLRDEMKQMATKNDLSDLRDEMKQMATKNDLSDLSDEMKQEFRGVKRQINDLKADTPTPQEFKDHDKRIKQLESAVFPS